VSRPGVALEEAIENIDIGGPAMLRSAAKNHESVTVVTDPADYAEVAAQIQAVRPHLRTKALPFTVPTSYFEMLWPAASDDDPPCRFARAQISRIAHALAK